MKNCFKDWRQSTFTLKVFISASEVRKHKFLHCNFVSFTPNKPFVLQLEDCALQIYRYHNGTQGDYSTYLDLESTIDEQAEDLEGFQDQ